MLKIFICLALIMALLGGCRGTIDASVPTLPASPTESAAPSTQPTESTAPSQPTAPAESSASAELLAKIWADFDEDEQFSVYGGTVEHAVDNAPGCLDITDTEELTTKYLLPQDQLKNITAGASLVHLMNNNIFTSGAFALAETADGKAVAKALRDNMQSTEWICGQPDRLHIALVQNQLVMAFGAEEIMEDYTDALKDAFPDAQTLYNEAVTA